MNYDELYRQSIEDPEAFWGEQARAIHWHTPPARVLEYSDPPFRRWFAGGTTNLCYNAVDRHLGVRADQPALVAISSETGQTQRYTYRELHREASELLKALGGGKASTFQFPGQSESRLAR